MNFKKPALLFGLLTLLVGAASGRGEFVAPYVPTTREDVDRMLELAGLGPTDYLIDLGSGDGRFVITAALRGAMGHGVELDGELVELARQRARDAEVEDLVSFEQGDIFDADLSMASVVTLYLMPEVNLRLRPKLLAELPAGARVLSNSFDMGEWRPDRHVTGRASGGLMLWIVPAHVGGRWSVSTPEGRFQLIINQQFQSFTAEMSHGAENLHILSTALRGDRIAILAGDGRRRYAFSGRVDETGMSGIVQVHASHGTRLERWQAVRRP